MQPNLRSFFIPLVRHEFNRKRGRRRQLMSRSWRLTYFLFFLAIALVLTTYFSFSYQIQLNYIWYIFLGLPWAIFGLSISKITREWSGETVGWWLTIPCSRQTLISAKFVAAFMRSVLIALAAYFLILLFGGYATLISAGLSFKYFGSFAESGIYFVTFDICSFPLAITSGLLYGALVRTKWRPAIPLFWIIWGVGWGMSGSLGLIRPSEQSFQISFALILTVVISWAASWLLLVLTAWLLEKKLDL